MLFTTVLSGPTLGATGTFTQGVDFNCNSSICYGIGAANHQLFKDLQATINRFAARGGFAALTVDGFIGNATVLAARVAANLAGIASGSTKEAVATNAPTTLSQLTSALLPSAPTNIPAIAPSTPAAFPSAPSVNTGTIVPTAQQVVQQQVAVQQAAAAQQHIAVQQAATAQAAAVNPLAPAQPPHAKVPTWVWIAAGVVGVVVIGAVGYAVMHKEPAPAGYADYEDYYGYGFGYAPLPRRRRRRRLPRGW